MSIGMNAHRLAVYVVLVSVIGHAAAFAPMYSGGALLSCSGNGRQLRTTTLRMQQEPQRGGNRDRIFPKYKESLERAKELDKANNGEGPSVLMREKKLVWPAPFGFLNTLKEENPQAYKAFQLAWFAVVVGIWLWPF